MGRDKALLPIHPGGPPLLQIVLEHLRSVAAEVLVVASNRPEYESFGAPLVADEFAQGGALSGIHAGLANAKHDRCFIVACDMPFLSRPLLDRMSREPRDYDVLVPVTRGESRQRNDGLVYQTLHAIYAKTCLAAIESQLSHGRRQVIGFFPLVRVRTLDLSDVSDQDATLRSFFNANSPEALALAAEMSTG
jgi:molybdenum cofactor guanylyltransferase